MNYQTPVHIDPKSKHISSQCAEKKPGIALTRYRDMYPRCPQPFYSNRHWVKDFLDTLLSYRSHMNLFEGPIIVMEPCCLPRPNYQCDRLPQMKDINKKKAMRGLFKLYVLCLDECYRNKNMYRKGKFAAKCA